jgi:hypothetical protein
MRRYVLILGLLIASSASAEAATLHRHDTAHRVFIGPKVASSFDAVRGSSTRHDDVASYNGRWDPWGHRGAYYGPMIAGPL